MSDRAGPMSQFETFCDPVEVTSSHRPDTSWRVVDPGGHEHRWFDGGDPATTYRPDRIYTVPSLEWVIDEPEGEDEPARGHHECRICRARVHARYTADSQRMFVPGLWRLAIDGVPVTEAEFLARFEQENGRTKVDALRRALELSPSKDDS